MNKIAFYNLDGEGTLIKNYKGIDLAYFAVTFIIVFINNYVLINIANILFLHISFTGLLKVIPVQVFLLLMTGALTTIISFIVTNPERRTGDSLIKTYFVPHIIYLVNPKVYSRYSKDEYFIKNIDKITTKKYCVILISYYTEQYLKNLKNFKNRYKRGRKNEI